MEITYNERVNNRIKLDKDWYDKYKDDNHVSFLTRRKMTCLDGIFHLDQLRYLVNQLDNLDRLEHPEDYSSDSENDPDKIGY